MALETLLWAFRSFLSNFFPFPLSLSFSKKDLIWTNWKPFVELRVLLE